jgi:hypothetical protein
MKKICAKNAKKMAEKKPKKASKNGSKMPNFWPKKCFVEGPKKAQNRCPGAAKNRWKVRS